MGKFVYQSFLDNLGVTLMTKMPKEPSTHNMDHMQYLEAIAASDVEYLKQQEAHYQGSWKRRGGIGAAMNLCRKWDRLNKMLNDPPTVVKLVDVEPTVSGGVVGTAAEDSHAAYDKWDVFAAMLRDAERGVLPKVSEDGTVLDQVRDLRQYLMLVEAEVMNQLDKSDPQTLPSSEKLEVVCDQVVAKGREQVVRGYDCDIEVAATFGKSASAVEATGRRDCPEPYGCPQCEEPVTDCPTYASRNDVPDPVPDCPMYASASRTNAPDPHTYESPEDVPLEPAEPTSQQLRAQAFDLAEMMADATANLVARLSEQYAFLNRQANNANLGPDASAARQALEHEVEQLRELLHECGCLFASWVDIVPGTLSHMRLMDTTFSLMKKLV